MKTVTRGLSPYIAFAAAAALPLTQRSQSSSRPPAAEESCSTLASGELIAELDGGACVMRAHPGVHDAVDVVHRQTVVYAVVLVPTPSLAQTLHLREQRTVSVKRALGRPVVPLVKMTRAPDSRLRFNDGQVLRRWRSRRAKDEGKPPCPACSSRNSKSSSKRASSNCGSSSKAGSCRIGRFVDFASSADVDRGFRAGENMQWRQQGDASLREGILSSGLG